MLKNKQVPASLKDKLQKEIEKYKFDFNFEITKKSSKNKKKYLLVPEIEPENLFLNNFNLRIGSPYSLVIEAACEEYKYLEVYYPNSIIYVGFALESKDINFEILKYENNENFNSLENFHFDNEKDNKRFKSIIRVDSIESSNIPIKVKFKN